MLRHAQHEEIGIGSAPLAFQDAMLDLSLLTLSLSKGEDAPRVVQYALAMPQ
jgi:hypothetical protein